MLRVRSGGQLSEMPLVDHVLRYRATDRRICLGYSSIGGGHVDCDEEAVAGERHCQSCRIRNAGFAANLHHAHTRPRDELSPAAIDHLSQPNLVYLAAFRDGSIKVGTSTVARHATRLIEQGAWVARIVAETGDGFVVREVEDLVTERLSVSQSVSAARKLAGMLAPVPDVELGATLMALQAQVHQLLASDRLTRPVDRPWRSPVADQLLWRHTHRYPFDLSSGEHHVQIAGAIGRLVGLRRPGRGDDVFLADIGQLFGVAARTGEYETADIAIQDSLF